MSRLTADNADNNNSQGKKGQPRRLSRADLKLQTRQQALNPPSTDQDHLDPEIDRFMIDDSERIRASMMQ